MASGTALILLSLALTAPAAGPAKPASGQAARHKLKPGATGAACLECHAAFQAVLKKPSVHTPVKSRDCTGCHDPHASSHGKLLSAAPGRVCFTCHAGVVPAQPVSSHRPIAEKGCTGCHDAHASANLDVLLKPQLELCGECHKPIVEGAAKAKFKHRPLEKEGCVGCHNPHGSAKARDLLKADVPALCVGCHKTGTPLFAQKHYGYPVAKSNCTSCHDPHGSGVRGMLYDKVHSPVAKGMCAQCHEAAGTPNALGTRQVGMQLCRGCHSKTLNAMLDKNRLHQPVVEGKGCLTCHGPHASKGPGLLRGTPITVCGSCHEDTIKRQKASPTKHQPVDDGMCASCHDPHGSNGPLLLANANLVESCGTCHDWSGHSSHPMVEKKLKDGTVKPVVDQRNPNLRVDCLSCHRAHGTDHKKMLLGATQLEMCSKCHTQYQR